MEVSNIQMWMVPILLWVVGMAAWIMTYILVPIKAKKTGTNISGIPGVAFFLFLMAGLLSPYKLLAFLCIIDFSVLWLIKELISAFFSGDLKYDWGKIFVGKMQHFLGYMDWDDSVKVRFDEYYAECMSNKEFKKTVKEYRFDFKRFCRIVAGLRTSKYMGCTDGKAYSIAEIWGMSDWDFEILKEILPEDVRDLAVEEYLAEKARKEAK